MSPLGDTNGGAAMFPKDSEQWSQNRTPPGRLCAPPPDLVGTAFPCLLLGPSATKNDVTDNCPTSPAGAPLIHVQ